jgi:hypothetical protein
VFTESAIASKQARSGPRLSTLTPEPPAITFSTSCRCANHFPRENPASSIYLACHGPPRILGSATRALSQDGASLGGCFSPSFEDGFEVKSLRHDIEFCLKMRWLLLARLRFDNLPAAGVSMRAKAHHAAASIFAMENRRVRNFAFSCTFVIFKELCCCFAVSLFIFRSFQSLVTSIDLRSIRDSSCGFSSCSALSLLA